MNIFQLTAREVAAQDDDLIFEYMKRREFRLAGMNGRATEAMFDAMIDEEGIKGGWFYEDCDGVASGPFATYQEAKDDATANANA